MRKANPVLRILSHNSRAAHLNRKPCHRIVSRCTPGAVGTTHFPPVGISNTRKFSGMPSSAAEQAQAAASSAEKSTPAQPELPPLTPAEFKVYNQMAEKMEYFVLEASQVFIRLDTERPRTGKLGNGDDRLTNHQHNHFRRQWTLLHDAATTGRRPQNMTLKQFLDTGLQFAQHLTAHHGIEETYVFPMLARKMPEFRGGRAELLRQHKEIHKGLDGFEEYLGRCRSRETELELSVLKEKMDSWGGVLWTHLDQEVVTLGAENMRRYWTVEEVRNMPM